MDQYNKEITRIAKNEFSDQLFWSCLTSHQDENPPHYHLSTLQDTKAILHLT